MKDKNNNIGIVVLRKKYFRWTKTVLGAWRLGEIIINVLEMMSMEKDRNTVRSLPLTVR